eukprot:CAMPEP_0172868226 /NCGR_PEP_ID=MMETSP1075-20121228/85784_1 /TAXON_ID=2916 /ORGANISM="Ceratium fusus, Strain PA161109" /LENGTH=39 /DNA_ID= /DNA_START= /DNA_END= /DNA_ORIENTATION=
MEGREGRMFDGGADPTKVPTLPHGLTSAVFPAKVGLSGG